MIDRIHIRAPITESTAAKMIEVNKLQQNILGGVVVWATPLQGRFVGGLDITIKKRVVILKCSLHKFYRWQLYGRLDNMGIFTMKEAKETLKDILKKTAFPKCGKIVLFEVGCNIHTKSTPSEYIAAWRGLGNKATYIDAFYQNDKTTYEKTTEKRKELKRFAKMYDKSHEWKDAHKGEPTPPEYANILRCENVYRRQNIDVRDFYTKMQFYWQTFVTDWVCNAVFDRDLIAPYGARRSQKENARFILLFGGVNFMEKAKNDKKSGKITQKEYRTKTEFLRGGNISRYRLIDSELYEEFKRKITDILHRCKPPKCAQMGKGVK